MRAEETSDPGADDVGVRRLVDSRQRVVGHLLSDTCPPVIDQRTSIRSIPKRRGPHWNIATGQCGASLSSVAPSGGSVT